MSTERANAVADKCCAIAYNAHTLRAQTDRIAEFLSTLPEFQSPQWVKCSERMPIRGQTIYLFRSHEIYAGYYDEKHGNFPFRTSDNGFSNVTHWMPRQVPESPVEEDSPLVKELKTERSRLQAHIDKTIPKSGETFMRLESAVHTADDFISIVQRHEKEKK